MAKNTQKQAPATAPEPAVPPAAIIEPTTAEDLIKALISTLGHKPADVAGIEIGQTRIRVLGKDRSLRVHRVEEWDANEEVAE